MFDPAIDLAGPAHTMVSWLGTYFVHSTVLIGGVWMFGRFLPLDALTRSLLWKMSLVGGLFTATLQTGLGVEPLFGTVSVESGTTAAPAPGTVTASPPAPVVAAAEPPPASFVHGCVGCELPGSQVVIVSDEGVTIIASAGPGWGDHGATWAGMVPPPAPPVAPLAPPAPVVAAARETPAGEAVPWVFAGLFLLGAAASLGRLGVTVARLRRGLHDRTPLRGMLRERLGRLLARARVPQDSVQLSMSERVGSPVALAGREIVVPERALELAPRQQEAMLAHELAHVIRRDPAWQVLAAVIEAALFFQPLNRVARRGMQEAAEELCDDWAVRHTGSSVHLARCLTEVAQWPGRTDMSGTFASPMAGRPSLLVRRVERLLDDRQRERGRWARRWRGLLGAALLAMVGLGAPGLSVARAEGSGTPPAPPTPPEPPLAPLAPEPLLALGGLPAGSMDMAMYGDDAPEKLSARQRRMMRRAERLERRAEKLRGKSGVTVVVPGDEPRQIVLAPEDIARIAREARSAAQGAIRLGERDIRELERAAAELAARASELDAAKIEAQAERLAAEIEAKVEALHLDEIGEAVEREVEALHLEDIGETVERELEKLHLDALPAEVHHEVARELQRARREHGQAAAEATREAERAQRAAERAKRRAAEVRPDVERRKREGAARARAGAEVQREVERALQDGTIDAAESRRIQEAAKRVAAPK